MRDKHMTDMDILGAWLAAEELAEKTLGILREKTSPANVSALESLDDLLKKDKAREEDGFPSKIKFRRVIIGHNRVIVVPYVEEERLVHGEFEPQNISEFSSFSEEDEDDIGETLGHGKGEVGDVIGQRPLTGDGDGDGDDGDGEGNEPGEGAGQDSSDHGLEEEAYEAGKKLVEELELPNSKEKRKKVPSDEYTYDLTDRHRGSGQVLDRKETLKRAIKTNLVLGRIEKDDIDPSRMVIAPQDKVFRLLSRERVWKSQALVFFLRDYSGSMWGEPTKALIDQHMMFYSWLLVQFDKLVWCRFIVHDTEAKEVSARQYGRLQSGGGTMIASAYQKINQIVEEEGLEKDYNIYVVQGTDGDDWDDGRRAVPELEKILSYVSRMGVTLFKHPYFMEGDRKTSFEQYVEEAGVLQKRDIFRMHVMRNTDVSEEMNKEALKALVAQD